MRRIRGQQSSATPKPKVLHLIARLLRGGAEAKRGPSWRAWSESTYTKGDEEIPRSYDVEELEKDLETLQELESE